MNFCWTVCGSPTCIWCWFALQSESSAAVTSMHYTSACLGGSHTPAPLALQVLRSSRAWPGLGLPAECCSSDNVQCKMLASRNTAVCMCQVTRAVARVKSAAHPRTARAGSLTMAAAVDGGVPCSMCDPRL